MSRFSKGSARWRSLPALALVTAGLLLAGHGVFIHAKAFAAQVLMQRAFAESLASGRPTRPWSWADTWPVARIEAPRLDISAIALEGASGQALAFGPGHLTSTPQAGDPGTAVYAAHRDTHFAFLKHVEPNDVLRVTRADGRVAVFRVTGHEVTRWDEARIDPAAPGRHLVLATCYPFDALTSGPLRYLVRAELERMEPGGS